MVVAHIHGLVALGCSKDVSPGGFCDSDSGGYPRRRAVAQLIRIEADVVADTADAFSSIAEKNRDGVIGMTGLNPNRKLGPLAVQFDPHHVAALDAFAVSHFRRHE